MGDNGTAMALAAVRTKIRKFEWQASQNGLLTWVRGTRFKVFIQFTHFQFFLPLSLY
jgi:hypothetical protein